MGAELDSFSDEELLKKYQDLGDVQALNLLFERYLSFAFSCFSKLLNDKATEKEVGDHLAGYEQQ